MLTAVDVNDFEAKKDVLFEETSDKSVATAQTENPSDSKRTPKIDAEKIIIKVAHPEKVGEGMSAYVVYSVKTIFRNASMCVQRRFSDFLALYDKLRSKYLALGVIIPFPPEKNVIGTAKLRISKNRSPDNDFIEKRRVTLECFINRLANHPVLRQDPLIQEFLEVEVELPKHSGAPVLSGSIAKRLLKNVGDAVGKWTYKMDEVDEYFDGKEQEFEDWDFQGNRLLDALANLIADQHELASAAQSFARSISLLANVEEHTGLARALGQLADTEEQIAHFHEVQAEAESIHLMEYAKGILSMLQACRDAMFERVKVYKIHKDHELALRSRREQKVRIEMSPKADRTRIPTLEREIEELVNRVDESETEFETISAAIKKELEYVDETRFEEFKTAAINFLTSMLQIQQNVLKCWESFIGHAKAIE